MTPVPAGRCGELRGRKDARSAVLRDAHDASQCTTTTTAVHLRLYYYIRDGRFRHQICQTYVGPTSTPDG